ncbi:UNVERIFIED_CONTAM: hypothetical protein Scaly_0002900 [Sesamum calycinum]|uniref:Uncharacterized protein n=1 Tax=Sesamum calycinum TaxID=2727403 RepID=A0AAW2SSX7_9LAMI
MRLTPPEWRMLLAVWYVYGDVRISASTDLTALLGDMELPAVGWIKLNLDGASKGKPGEAGAGGLLCDHIDIVLAAFYEFPGFKTNLYAKLMAVFRGSEISIELGTLGCGLK